MALSPTTLRAQTPPPPAGAPAAQDPLAQAYTAGMAAFAKGDYAAAVAAMELVISKASEESPLDSVYYTLGAAQFNLQQFVEAIEALKTYTQKYPKGSKGDEATFFIGQAQIQLKDFEAAVKTLAPLESKPAYREQVLLLQGTAYKEAAKLDAAIAVLEKLTTGGARSAATANGMMLLADVYAQKGESEKAIALLKAIRKNTALLDNVVRVNAMAIELGDGLLKDGNPEDALLCYQLVQSKEEVVRQQKTRIAALEQQVAKNLVTVRNDPQRVPEISAENDRLRAAAAKAREQLSAFEKTADFEGPFWLRVARAHSEKGDKWEAITIYDELLRRQPTGPDREPALFGLVVTSAEANRVEKTKELADLYTREFPNSANAGTVGYLLGANALQSGDAEGAVKYFGEMLAGPNSGSYREQIAFLLGNAHFNLGDFEKARADYAKYLADFPAGSFVEEAKYRTALAALFSGKYDDAQKEITAYIAAYPKGTFVSDGKYRLGVCQYAASDYEAVIASCEAWQKEFPGDPLLGEVLALEADALAPLEGREEESIDTYIASLKAAQTEEVLNHSLGEGAKLMQKRGDWEKLGNTLNEFVTANPNSPVVVAASYWIAKAKAKEGKPDEARGIIAGVIKQKISDPGQPAVEQLITQLAQLFARRKPADPAATATPAADPAKELETLLGVEAKASETSRARVLFAKAELARFRKDPKEQEANLAAIGQLSPEKLSPVLLAQVGDFLLAKGQTEKADAFFKELMADYPKSEYLDYAYNGFGEIAYDKKDYPAALKFFTDAIDKAGASQKLKEVTIGQAKTLLAMGRLDEAKKLFEQIASTRQWRGESTAFSIYSLGEIEEKKGKLAEAIAFYQRVYVAYGRFLPWVAKAYVRSAECFEKLGKKQEAVNTYREMLRNEKLADFAGYAEARQKLEGTATP